MADPRPTRGPIVVASLDKNRREKVRVALDEYQGTKLIDLRITVELTESSGIQTPTRKGVALNVGLLPELRAALAEAEAQALALGWLSPEGS